MNFPDRVSGAVEILFQSDAARLGKAPDDCVALPGTVVQRSYLGSVYRHEVQLGRNRVMADSPEEVPIGSDVDVCVPATALRLFPAKSQTAVTGPEAATTAATHP